MNMFLHELKAYRKSTAMWTIALILVVAFFMSLFPAISHDAAQFKKILAGYPVQIRKAFGVSIDSITSLLGFYSYVFSYVILCGSIQAMNLGISVLSKEVREKTADFLLTKPVTRTEIITAKLLAAFCSLMISNAILISAAFIIASVVSKQDFAIDTFILISLTAVFVELMFMALGVVISVAAARIKAVLPLSLGLVFGFFIINMFGSVIGEETIRYLTPFKYYDTAYIIQHGGYEGRFIAIEAVFIVVNVIASYFIYAKKDIHAV